MCEVCLKNPCHRSCPNADGDKLRFVAFCEACDEAIYANELHYKIKNQDSYFCEHCVTAIGG